MPFYEYRCQSCQTEVTHLLKMSEMHNPPPCKECGSGDLKKLVSRTSVIFKGDGWASKNNRIRNQMRKKNQRLTQKQNEMKRDAPSVNLVPNVGGERTESWSDAAKLARDKGKDTSGYDKLARKEKSNK